MAEYKSKYTGSQIDAAIDLAYSLPDEITALSEELNNLQAQGLQQTPLFADSIEECTDQSKLYVLPDGYIYAYMYAEGGGANYTNLADPDSADWLTGQRINSSGVLTTYTGSDAELLKLTNLIPIADVQDVHIKGIDLFDGLVATGNNYNRVYWYDGSKTLLLTRNLAGGEMKAEFYERSADYDSDVTIIHVADCAAYYGALQNGAAQYIRFGGLRTVEADADIAIACDQQISYSTGGYAWQNTGYAFVSAGYEDRIVNLENIDAAIVASLENQQGIMDGIEERVAKLEEGEVVSIPDYWTDAVDVAVSKVKALQDAGGKDMVSFVWLSDLHYAPGDAYTKNIGHLCAELMDRCNIPYTLLTGDTMSAAVVDSEATLLSYLDGAAELLSPIGSRILHLRGNHDDVWGSCTTDGETASYVNKAAPGKVWNRIGRRQTLDANRVFGGDGSYFYADIPAQKVRFVCMNSHYYDGPATSDGTTKNMTTGFGTEQLDWLQNVALAVDDDWRVVIATHVPINNSYYLEQYSDGAAFCNIIDSTAANILAIFSGHCHADAVYTSGSRCPNMTITCAVNSTYDSTEAARTAGTTTETALDVVCINRETGAISTVRLGVGSDRSYPN